MKIFFTNAKLSLICSTVYIGIAAFMSPSPVFAQQVVSFSWPQKFKHKVWICNIIYSVWQSIVIIIYNYLFFILLILLLPRFDQLLLDGSRFLTCSFILFPATILAGNLLYRLKNPYKMFLPLLNFSDNLDEILEPDSIEYKLALEVAGGQDKLREILHKIRKDKDYEKN
jgi:hypothetical protein